MDRIKFLAPIPIPQSIYSLLIRGYIFQPSPILIIALCKYLRKYLS
jgi:hypothetical protein